MLDFIESINPEREIKSEKIYELFKTESFDLNLKFLSNIKQYKTLNEFITYYGNKDFKNFLKIFDKINSMNITLSNKNKKDLSDSKKEKYFCDISLIIIQLSLIEKTSKLLNNLMKSLEDSKTKFEKNYQNKAVQESITKCFNDLISSFPFKHQDKSSLRQLKERTLSSYDILQGNRNSIVSNITTDDSENIIFENRNNTPKFKDKDSNKKSNGTMNQKKEGDMEKGSEKTIDSVLSLKNMKFLYDSGDKNLRAVRKKNKTIKIGIERQETNHFFKQKSNSNKINENNNFNEKIEYNLKNVDKSQILADLLNSINCLYKNSKIGSEQKLYLKQLLISDSEKLIERFYKYNEINIALNSNLKSLFKNFLIGELKNMR